MNNIRLQGLSFKMKPIKPKRIKKLDGLKKVSKLVRGVCFIDKEDDDKYKIYINMHNDPDYPDYLILEFTEDSKKLKGKTKIFTKEPDKKGKYTCIIRSEEHAYAFPNSPELYTPFCINWLYDGYIVRVDGKMLFQVTECVAKNHHSYDSNDYNDFNNKPLILYK